MRFVLELHCAPGFTELESIGEPGGDLVTVVMDGCALLAEAGCSFIAGGFGDDSWAVDVGYDLSIVLQQLPDVLGDMRASRPTRLAFSGQGVERVVDISPVGGELELECRSGTDWQPEPRQERVSPIEFESLLVRLASDFADAVSGVSPDLGRSSPLPAWRRGDI